MSEDLQALREIHSKVKDQISLEDFRARIGEKIRDHYGLLSDVGAAKLIAREMGATFEAPQISFKIKNLVPGMQSVDVTGRVVRIYGVRTFDRETGSGKVSNLLIMDETGNVRVVLWGEKAEPVEEELVRRGDVVQIRSGYTRTGLSGEVEVHVGRRGRMLVNPAMTEAMPELEETKIGISEVKVGMRDVDVEGVVSGISNVRTFNRPDGASGRVATLFLRDKTGEIRVSLWNEKTEGLEQMQKGSSVRIVGAYTKAGLNDSVELHCSGGSEISVGEGVQVELPEIEPKIVALSSLEEGMQSVDVGGRVQRMLGRRTFTRLNGQDGKVANLIISDGTAEVRLVLWGEAAEMTDRLVEGSRVRVENAYTKLGLNQEMEVHVGWRGRVVRQIEEFQPMLCDLDRGMEGVDLTVGIVEVGLPEEFEDAKLVSAVIGDATGRVPAVFWDGHVDPVQDLDPGTTLRITNAKVNDMGEVQVLPESSLETTDQRLEVLEDDEAKTAAISDVQPGVLCRVRGAPVAVTDLRHTSSFGPKKLLCTCRVDDGSGQISATLFGSHAARLLNDGTQQASQNDLRASFRQGTDWVFIGVVVDGRLRVREVESPEPREEVTSLLQEIGEGQ